MIFLKAERQHTQAVITYFFPYLDMLKTTKLKNVAHCEILSEPVLSVIAINCLITDIQQLLQKKLINTAGPNLKIKLSNAEAVTFYRALISLPFPASQIYLHNIRNHWIEQLDQQLIAQNIYQVTPKQEIQSVATFEDYLYEE